MGRGRTSDLRFARPEHGHTRSSVAAMAIWRALPVETGRVGNSGLADWRAALVGGAEMKVGIFMMPVHPPEKDRTECFEEDLELVVLADRLGYTEAWIGQHFSVPWEPIPSNDIFIANALPRTKSIIFGTGVTLIQYHHPVNAALRLAYLDHLSRARRGSAC